MSGPLRPSTTTGTSRVWGALKKRSFSQTLTTGHRQREGGRAGREHSRQSGHGQSPGRQGAWRSGGGRKRRPELRELDDGDPRDDGTQGRAVGTGEQFEFDPLAQWAARSRARERKAARSWSPCRFLGREQCFQAALSPGRGRDPHTAWPAQRPALSSQQSGRRRINELESHLS